VLAGQQTSCERAAGATMNSMGDGAEWLPTRRWRALHTPDLFSPNPAGRPGSFPVAGQGHVR